MCSDYEGLLRDGNQTTSVIGENTSRVGKYWRPPVRGGLKINCDASFNRQRKSGFAGIIIRSEIGEFITGLTKQFYANSPLVAEALALQEAVVLAANLGLMEVVFEGDNLDLMKTAERRLIGVRLLIFCMTFGGLRCLPDVFFPGFLDKGARQLI